MKQKIRLAGMTLLAVAMLAGCSSNSPADSSQQSSQTQTAYISMEEAQAAALEAAHVPAAAAEVSSATLSEVVGIPCYKVEFTSGGYAYAYSIHAESGEVLEMSSREQAAAANAGAGTQAVTPASGTQAAPASGTQAVTPASGTPASAINPSAGQGEEARAQEIALAHAGVKATEATITKSKLDYDDGRSVYEIEWYANGAKYEYEIDAATGEVVQSGYEAKTVAGTGNGVAVSEADAKQTALGRVSGATVNDIYEWKLDYDDGRPEYEGKIIYNGTEYEFTVDATSGAITEWDAEALNR